MRSADKLTECQNRTTLAGRMLTRSLRLTVSLSLPLLSLSLPPLRERKGEREREREHDREGVRRGGEGGMGQGGWWGAKAGEGGAGLGERGRWETQNAVSFQPYVSKLLDLRRALVRPQNAANCSTL